jgi:hypothetical protein
LRMFQFAIVMEPCVGRQVHEPITPSKTASQRDSCD